MEWITQKSATAVYHKCSDILLEYIADAWSRPRDDVADEMEGVLEGSSLVEPFEEKAKIVEEEPASHSCLGEFLIAKIQSHQAQLYSVLIPIVEKLTQSGNCFSNLKILIEHIPAYCKREIKHEFKDVAINHIKLLGLIAVKGKVQLKDQNNQHG